MDETLLFWLKVFIYILTFIIFIFLYFLEQWPTPRRFSMIQNIPGPKGVFYFGNAYELIDVPLDDFLNWLASKLKCYDRIMKMWFLGVSHVYFMQPEDIQVILNSKQHITKGIEYSTIMAWLKDGLLTSTGNKWFGRRKLLTPAFHFKILEDNLVVFNKNARILVDKLKKLKGKEESLDSLLTLCTLDIIITTAMGIDIDAQSKSSQGYVAEIKRISELIVIKSVKPQYFKDWIFALSSFGRQFWKTVKFLHDFSSNVINERKANYEVSRKDNSNVSEGGKVRRALLDTLLEIERVTPGTFTDLDIREEVDTFMFEGHDTTSVALVYIFFNLARFPEIQDKVYEELFDIFGDDDREATSSDLSRMTYTEKVIKESLRLYPSVPYISRTLEQDLVLEDGITIPVPSNVVLPIYFIHRNEKYWPDPEKFDPERFSEEQAQGRHPYAYIPFSAGPRNCIGQKFAMMELKIVISTVIRSLKVLPVTKLEDIKFMLNMVLRCNKQIFCRFAPR